MYQPTKARNSRAIRRLFPGQRMTTLAVNTDTYATRIAEALRQRWGDSRSGAKQIAETVGAGVGTVRKWLRAENGPTGVHLLRLVAESDEVWNVVLELSGRDDNADARQHLRRALAILDGKEAP